MEKKNTDAPFVLGGGCAGCAEKGGRIWCAHVLREVAVLKKPHKTKGFPRSFLPWESLVVTTNLGFTFRNVFGKAFGSLTVRVSIRKGYVSLDLIRIVGTTLSGQPAYIRIIRERHLAKIEIFIRICRRPQPKFAILIRTFRWPLREFWGVLAAPAVLWWDRVRGIDCPLLCWRIPLLKNSFSKNEETTRHKSKEWGRDNVELGSYKLYKNKAALLVEW